ncbi:hypothetical protein TNIN_467421 [Trichonephila inaurata madagascariensis]|uniref:Uncharacterized protein n=1 Tax=Trichonephila inaurata madagascariensis TaxID=2747483 RepID=A0A8X6XAC5_9ARAC|nr:hypothetical protein TNIN_467421 [Trichonephila inaurata madagascariensis]
MTLRIVLQVDAPILSKNNAHMGVDMVHKDRCVLVLLHRAFHNDERTQKMPGKHSPDHNAPASSLDRSTSGSRVFAFRGFLPYAPTFIRTMEHKM